MPIPSFPQDLIYKDAAGLTAKIARFIEAGPEKVHFVFDFDRTLTVPNPQAKEDINSWTVLRDHLPLEGQQRCADLFTIYRTKEIDSTMTNEDAVTWWSSILNIYTEYHLNLTDVENDFLSRANIRPGTAELFSMCRELQIPTVILSAGIKDVIDLWSRVYDIPSSLVLSTVLELDESSRIIGWDKSTLIHALNKAEADHSELRAIREKRPYAMVIGDSINDADMAAGEEQTLRIRILDPRPDEITTPKVERQKTFERFDALIEIGTLAPTTEILRQIIG